VAIVHNPGPPSGNACASLRLHPLLTIPARRDLAAVPSLYKVRGATRLGDGRLVVLNAGTEQLLLFTPGGEPTAAVGRRGGGPGEFVGPDWLGRAGGDTLLVWDTRLNRLSFFHAGSFLRSLTLPGRPSVRGRFPDGSLLVRPVALVKVSGDGLVKRDSLSYERLDLVQEATTTLVTGLSAEWVDAKTGPYDLPFGHGDMFVAHGPSLVGGDTGQPAIRFYDLAGRLHRIVTWASPAVRVSSEDRRRVWAHWSQSRPGRDARPPEMGAVRPRFSAIRSDSEGWLWVREYRAPWEESASWLLFDPVGVRRCRIETPGNLTVLEIGKDYLLGRLEEEDGEESVALFGLRRQTEQPDESR